MQLRKVSILGAEPVQTRPKTSVLVGEATNWQLSNKLPSALFSNAVVQFKNLQSKKRQYNLCRISRINIHKTFYPFNLQRY